MQGQGRTRWLAARTNVFRDVRAVVGLVKFLKAGKVVVEGGPIAQLDAIGQHQEAARAQHARHLSRGCAPNSRRKLVEQVDTCHLPTAVQLE